MAGMVTSFTFLFYAKIPACRSTCCLISLYAKYDHIFEKGTSKLLSWRIYVLINFMVTMPLTLRTTGRPKRHLKKIPDEEPLKSETLDLFLIKAINITKDSLVVVNLSLASNI